MNDVTTSSTITYANTLPVVSQQLQQLQLKTIESLQLTPLSTWKIENTNTNTNESSADSAKTNQTATNKPFFSSSISSNNGNNLSPALYQYDYNIKSAKFANSNNNSTSSNLFANNPNAIKTNQAQHLQQQSKNIQQQQSTPPPISTRPEKTKSIVTKKIHQFSVIENF